VSLTAAEETALDDAIADVTAGAARWAALTPAERADVLTATHRSIGSVAEAWVAAACRAKGIDPEAAIAAEEWMSGPFAVLFAAKAFADTLRRIDRTGSSVPPGRFGTAPGDGEDEDSGDRVTVRVLPTGLQQRLMFHGFRAEVWMPPGVDAAEVPERAGRAARDHRSGGVGLVLGAGNITAIGPLDVFTELVSANRTVVLKLNPTLDGLLPVYEEALRPLLVLGVLRIVRGAGDVGAYLVDHPGIAHVHVTGSGATHDAIVWGVGEDAERRRIAGGPRLRKPITSELGGVSPVIVVPGDWSAADLRFQAEHVATMRLHNAGHNCIAAQTLILSADWAQKDAFLDELRAVLRELPARAPWYPGTAGRLERARERHPEAEDLGGRLLIQSPPGDESLDFEYFGPVLGVTELAGVGAAFLHDAVDFANEELAGTLGANLLIDPRTRRALGGDFAAELARLRYGTIAVNAWTSVGFSFPGATWGAFPGHDLADVGSGIGVVHNAFLLDWPERTVVTGPFRPFPRSVLGGEWSLFPKPPWFLTARSALETGRRLTVYAARPGWGRLLATLLTAFRA